MTISSVQEQPQSRSPCTKTRGYEIILIDPPEDNYAKQKSARSGERECRIPDMRRREVPKYHDLEPIDPPTSRFVELVEDPLEIITEISKTQHQNVADDHCESKKGSLVVNVGSERHHCTFE